MEEEIVEVEKVIEEEPSDTTLTKPKKPRSAKQIEAFKKAQELRLSNAKEKRELIDKIKEKKPSKVPVVVEKPIVKKEESDSEDEIIVVKKRKPKKKIIYVEESDEEEVKPTKVSISAPIAIVKKKPFFV